MNPVVILALLVAAAAAAPSEVIRVELGDQNHKQQGEAGTAVTGSYSFTDADGVTHTTTYIADERGYRVIGRSSSGGVAKPAYKAPAPAPAPKPVPVPVPAPAPVPAPIPVPVVAPAPVAVAPAPAPAPIRYVQVAAPAPVATPAPAANGGLVYYVVGGGAPFGAQFAAAPQAIKTAEIPTSAVQSPYYYVVSGSQGAVPLTGAKAVAGQPQFISLAGGAQPQFISLAGGAQQFGGYQLVPVSANRA